MNLRPLYTILTSFCIAILLIVGLYYYGHNADSDNQSSNLKNTTIQLLPKPIILDDQSTPHLKNNALEKLMTTKSDKIISITDATIDFSNVLPNLPFDLQKLSIYFRYNKNDDRIDFEGHTNRRYQVLEISGHYKHTQYNQIHYVINISNDENELTVNALYTPSTKETSIDSLTGQFIMKTNSSTLLKHISQKEDMSITGNFYKTDNLLKLDKITLSSNTINLNAEAEITHNNTIANISISDTDINELEQNLNLPGLYNELFEIFPQISKNKSSTSITLNNVSYNSIRIDDGILKLTTNNNKLSLEKLSLLTNEKIKINSKGDIVHTPLALEYIGSINVTNLSTDSLNNFIKLDGHQLNQDRDIEVMSKIKITPPLIHLTDLKIVQGFTEIASDLKQYTYGDNNITLSSSDIRNYRQNNQKLSFFDLIIQKYNQMPKIQAIKNNTKKFIHAKLNFNNLHTQNKTYINNASASYTETPHTVKIGNINTASPNLNIDGEMSFDLKNDPKASIIFRGDKSDAYALYSLISNTMLNCASLEDCRTFLQNTTKFKGKIFFDIEGTENDTTPLSSLKCSTTIDSNLNLKQCNATLFDGKLVMNGNIHIGDKVKYSINYDLIHANGQMLIKHFLTNKIQLEGYFNNIKGIFASYGLNKDSFIKNLNGNAHLKASHAKIKKMDLKKLIKKHDPYSFPTNTNQKKVSHIEQTWFDINNLDAKIAIKDNEAKSSHFFFDTNHKIKADLSQVEYNILTDHLQFLMRLKYRDYNQQATHTKFRVNGTLKDANMNARLN